jgi:hypothetical protein
MSTFKVNIFGTANNNAIYQETTTGYFLFNLHVLQVDFGPLVLSSFDMFLEFYAFPFNPINRTLKVSGPSNQTNPLPSQQLLNVGTSVLASATGNTLEGRVINKKPQVIHITATTPTSTINLYNCGTPTFPTAVGLGVVNPCTPLNPTSPCPNPIDFRIFSMSHYVKTIPTPIGGQRQNVDTFTPPPKDEPPQPTTTTTTTIATPPVAGAQCFDPDWTDMRSNLQQNGYYLLTNDFRPYKLPIKITIVANGCKYTKNDFVNIYPNYLLNKGVYGSADCVYNPLYKPLGFDDFITVS